MKNSFVQWFGRLVVLALVSGFMGLFFLTERVSAIPSFARRYETACTTCHIVPPKLNAFGIAFKNNGYRIPVDDEKFIKQPDVPMGAPGWKKVWPEGVWPGAIPDRVPLSVAVEMVTDIAPDESVKVDFAFPEEFELLAGGTLGSRFSYLGELAFEFDGGETEVDFERGHFNIQLLENNPLMNLRLGRFETGATPFSRFSYRLTDEDFIVSNFRAVDGGFRFRGRQQGFELWGARNGPGGGGFQYSLGLVNGKASSNDDNSQKDFYAGASYKFGGFGVAGPATSLDTLKSTQNYIDNSVEVGVFGYVGRTGETSLEEVRFDRMGFKVNAYLDRLNLFGAYVRGRDLVLIAGPPRISTDAWFVEGDVVTWPWLVGIFRYDQAVGDPAFLHVKRVVPGVALMIRANVVLTAEAPIYLGDKNALSNGEVAKSGAVVRLSFFF